MPRLVTSPAGVSFALDRLANRSLGLDLETVGDAPSGRIRLISLAGYDDITGEVESFVFDLDELGGFPPELKAFLSWYPEPIAIHNAVYDLSFLLAAGVVLPRVWDTMAAAQVLAGGTLTPKELSLAETVRREFGESLDKTLQKSDWAGPLSQAQLDYAAADAAWAVRLMKKQVWEVTDELRPVVELENRVVFPVAWMTVSGVLVDTERWRTLAEGHRREMEAAQAEFSRLAAQYTAKTDLWGAARVNLNSPQQVLSVLRAAGLPVADTDSDTLGDFADNPLVRLVLKYRYHAKRLGTYGEDWLKHVNPTTGRVHPSWWTVRAATGRMACSNPNLQNIPRDSEFRSCIVAPPGRVLIKADYSQIELRIAAELANDPRMIAAFNRGEDLHSYTVREILNKEVTKETRQLAKVVNFGLIYGMGAQTLQQYAKLMYGINLDLKEAERLRWRFFNLYDGIRAWHRRQAQVRETKTILGRVRRFREKLPFTELLNSPVQGTGADGLKNALSILWQTRDLVPEAFPILAVHDEIVVEAPENQADRAAKWLKYSMLAGMAEFLIKVPVEVEVKIGRTWAG